LVINDTKVMPARITGVKEGTGAAIEALLLRALDAQRWEALLKPGKRVSNGTRVSFGDGTLIATQEADLGKGVRVLRFDGDGPTEEILERIGGAPLPPYIKSQTTDKSRYQTVYAVHYGSAAAPTAGLHFTEGLLQEAVDAGVHIARVTLHVGLGTFGGVDDGDIAEHKMHAEYCAVEASQAAIINEARRNGGRIVCVGTTSCRTLESRVGIDDFISKGDDLSQLRESHAGTDGVKSQGVDSSQLRESCVSTNGLVLPGAGFTDIFIYPGYEFKVMDAIITNFHLPESTLIMLVSAFAGRENVLRAYKEAVEREYRFFSFGDAMLVV